MRFHLFFLDTNALESIYRGLQTEALLSQHMRLRRINLSQNAIFDFYLQISAISCIVLLIGLI